MNAAVAPEGVRLGGTHRMNGVVARGGCGPENPADRLKQMAEYVLANL